MKIHVITEGFVSPNGRAFLFPLHRHRVLLHEMGMELEFFDKQDPSAADCDILLLDSKAFRDGWGVTKPATLRQFEDYRARCDHLVFCDNSDSAGWILGDALAVVDSYWKGLVLRNRAAYATPMYARRSYSDFYHRQMQVEDEEVQTRAQVDDPLLLNKIQVSWNSGLADYSLHGPSLMALRGRLPFDILLRKPTAYAPADRPRSLPISCRMGINYRQKTVRWQREQIARMVRDVPTEKVRRRAFFDEMKAARLTLSPFGLGEITLKDFEVFLCGSLLVKPDMSLLETWPDMYQDKKTCIFHAWDLSDLRQCIDRALSEPERSVAIATAGQEKYLHHVSTHKGAVEFATRLESLVSRPRRGIETAARQLTAGGSL